MQNNFFNKKLTISDVIDYAKIFNEDTSDKFARFPYLYTDKAETPIKLTSKCYLDLPPKVIENKDVFSDFVKSKNLEVLCTGDVFIDVYDALASEKEDFTKYDFINALNYYLENDDFMEL